VCRTSRSRFDCLFDSRQNLISRPWLVLLWFAASCSSTEHQKSRTACQYLHGRAQDARWVGIVWLQGCFWKHFARGTATHLLWHTSSVAAWTIYGGAIALMNVYEVFHRWILGGRILGSRQRHVCAVPNQTKSFPQRILFIFQRKRYSFIIFRLYR